MSDREKQENHEAKENFVKVTWKEIVAGTISVLIIGAVTFVFSNFNGRLTHLEAQAQLNKDNVERIDLLMEAELRNAINSLTEELEENTGEFTLFRNNQRSLERSITRLETIIERLEVGR